MHFRKAKYVVLGLLICTLWYSSAAFADTYTYDELNRLTSVTMDSGEQLTYSYDASGNITSVQPVQAAGSNAIKQSASAAGTAYGWDTYSSAGVMAEYEAVTNSVYGDGVRVKVTAKAGGEASISQMATVTGNTYYQLQGGIQALSLNHASLQSVIQFFNSSDQLIGETNETYDEQPMKWQALSVGVAAPLDAVKVKIQFAVRLDSGDASADMAVSGIRLLQAGGQP